MTERTLMVEMTFDHFAMIQAYAEDRLEQEPDASGQEFLENARDWAGIKMHDFRLMRDADVLYDDAYITVFESAQGKDAPVMAYHKKDMQFQENTGHTIWGGWPKIMAIREAWLFQKQQDRNFDRL